MAPTEAGADIADVVVTTDGRRFGSAHPVTRQVHGEPYLWRQHPGLLGTAAVICWRLALFTAAARDIFPKHPPREERDADYRTYHQ